MSDVRVLPLRSRDLPPALVRLYTKARVYKIPEFGWVWSHQCDHHRTDVAKRPYASQGEAFSLAWSHMRRCV